MTLHGCMKCLKYVVFTFNFIVWVSRFAIVYIFFFAGGSARPGGCCCCCGWCFCFSGVLLGWVSVEAQVLPICTGCGLQAPIPSILNRESACLGVLTRCEICLSQHSQTPKTMGIYQNSIPDSCFIMCIGHVFVCVQGAVFHTFWSHGQCYSHRNKCVHGVGQTLCTCFGNHLLPCGFIQPP